MLINTIIVKTWLQETISSCSYKVAQLWEKFIRTISNG